MKSLNTPVKLAGNPSSVPHFKTTIKTSKGSLDVSDPQALRALISLMDMEAVMGGAASHFGGPSALAELVSVVHAWIFEEAKKNKKPWYEMFNLVNDIGHCENIFYALKANYGFADLTLEDLRNFRSITSPLTGHGESHLFPEGVLLSNGPLGSAFPQTQGLCAADKLAERNRTTVCFLSDGACMEGEAKEALAAIPGLAAKGLMNPYVLVISDNNTKLSGRIDKDAFSMEPTFQSMKTLGWKLITLENGHDIEACANTFIAALEEAQKNPNVPVAIQAKTVKGYGVKKLLESVTGGHGFPLKKSTELPDFVKELFADKETPPRFVQWMSTLEEKEKSQKSSGDGGEKIQKGVASALIAAAKKGYPIISVTSDLPGSTGLADFRKEFPKNSIDVGVAESNMVSMAAGLAKGGFIPVVDTFAQFGVTKGALPLTMASLSNAPVIAIYSHTGFQDAADGASHQALSYIAMTSSIPNVKVFALSCSQEANALISQAIEDFKHQQEHGEGVSYVFFLGRENFPSAYAQDVKYDLTKAQILFDNASRFQKSVTIITHGSLVPDALIAAQELEKKDLGAIVINSPAINHPDMTTIKSALQKTGNRLIVVEDHQFIGGFAQILSHELLHERALAGKGIKMETLAVDGQFGQSAYTANDLYKKHGLDAISIARSATTLMAEN